MAFIINQGFDLKSPQFNFERDYFNNVAELKAAKEDWFPDNFITNVGGTLYQLKKSNSVDSTTGKWRILKVAPDSTYSHPTGSAANKALGFYKFSTDATSHISSVSAVTKDDITKLGIPSADTHYTTKLIVGNSITATNNAAATNGNVWLNLLDNTTLREKHNIVGTGRASVTSDANGKITIGVSNYSTATTSADGLMASTDKAKLDGIAAGANKTVVDSTLSTSSINPVQNKVINSALEGKADSDVGVFTVGVGTPELTINASTADEPSKNMIYATGVTGTADIIIQHANSTGAVDDVVKVNVDGIVVNEHRAAIGATGDANNQDWTLTGSKTQITGKSITSPKFVKTGGTSKEILMADGSVATSITTSQIQALFN
nr:MAG TPA: hypothetical protein [Crassvirales sp.]